MLSFLWRFTWRVVLLALIALTLLQFWFFACVWYWSAHNPDSTAFMRSRLEKLREEQPGAKLQYLFVPYQRISPHLKRAVIAAEDARFFQHDGFDWDGIRKAYEKNVREGEVVAGGSTISQQLAKNLFLSGERAWWRKGQEAAITVMIELIMDKRRILELYLNVIEWGDAVFGAEAAARYHYGTSAAQLGTEQAARLAAMVPSPRRYSPGRNTAYLDRRTATILARMNGVRVP
ncbi:MAG TPA: monofunctional biosynthetic peptidoglycan transglycosylase [Burkholderiales bacterium]|jgi:monofunctional biosynthetic peptidoglycan transglycosylase|nr:monofunctional biosynthetic peptidoglycan transglycosylase [Burkholderiales bacterium]